MASFFHLPSIPSHGFFLLSVIRSPPFISDHGLAAIQHCEIAPTSFKSRAPSHQAGVKLTRSLVGGEPSAMPPVTEIAQFSLPDHESVPAFVAAFREAMRLQDKWCAAHCDPPQPPEGPQPATAAEARGAALYARADGGPRDILITAHWASLAEHEAWIASPANTAACAQFVDAGLNLGGPGGGGGSSPHHGLVHLDGVAAFSPAVMRAPRVGLLRFAVRRTAPRAAFAEALDALAATPPPCEGGGWRVEPFGQGICDEFVVIGGGWPTAAALATTRDLFVRTLGVYVENCVAHLYERLV